MKARGTLELGDLLIGGVLRGAHGFPDSVGIAVGVIDAKVMELGSVNRGGEAIDLELDG